MHKESNYGRFRSPDGLKSSVFKAIRNTNAERNDEIIRCPCATIDDELEIGDFRIFEDSKIKQEQNLRSKLQEQERNGSEPSTIFSSTDVPLLGEAVPIVRWIQVCSTGDLQTVGMLSKEKPYLISYAPAINHGFSGLHYAAKNGHTSVLRFLVMNGANVNLQTSGYTPLHLAAIGKQQEIISVLLRDCAADASIEDYSGNTYQHYLSEEQGIARGRIKNENIIRSKKYELQQNDAPSSAAETSQFPRLKSFRKAVHERMRFFAGHFIVF